MEQFTTLLDVAFKLVRQEQAKKPDGTCFAFYVDHATMVGIKYNLDPESSIMASEFVYKDKLLGYPIYPVLSRGEGSTKVPTLTIINLASDICYNA